MEHRLPKWDLSDLYTSKEDESVKNDIALLKKNISEFKAAYEHNIANLPADALGEAVAAYETIEEISLKLMSYAYLLFAEDFSNEANGQFYQNITEQVNESLAGIVFFTLEINLLEEEHLVNLLQESETLHNYEPWLRDTRVFSPYQLSKLEEELLHEKSVTGRQAWSRLFDETLSSLTFSFDDNELTLTEIFDQLSSPMASVRKKAAKAIGKTLGDNIKLFAMITNVLAKDKAIEDSKRGFKNPISSRNLANLIEDEVVDSLISTVEANYPALSHRYYKYKAKLFGQEKLDYWDRNAPLPDDESRYIPWDEAQQLVLAAYESFCPDMAVIGQKFFDHNWIDAAIRKGKDSGAFSHPTVVSAHPYILMNYQGKQRDVMTLAHELGHGIHQYLAREQGTLLSDTPLTMAETASVFGEQLVFRSLLAREKDPKLKQNMIAGKVEDMLNTVVRQIAFCQFEQKIHHARKKGELDVAQICNIWIEVQQKSLGEAIRFEDEYKYFWSYIPHFIHSPFYVYAYAFGDCLVNSLYANYREKPSGFSEKYVELLQNGGRMRYDEALKPFGLDAKDPEFWQAGLGMITELMNELD